VVADAGERPSWPAFESHRALVSSLGIYCPKNKPLAGETGVWEFFKSGVGFLLLMRTVGVILPRLA
jgi:hypothetical protein